MVPPFPQVERAEVIAGTSSVDEDPPAVGVQVARFARLTGSGRFRWLSVGQGIACARREKRDTDSRREELRAFILVNVLVEKEWLDWKMSGCYPIVVIAHQKKDLYPFRWSWLGKGPRVNERIGVETSSVVGSGDRYLLYGILNLRSTLFSSWDWLPMSMYNQNTMTSFSNTTSK